MDDCITKSRARQIVLKHGGSGASPALLEIDREPAADVRPVVHGEWGDYGEGVCCSNCGVSLFHQDENNNWGIEPSGFGFCPYCGADMRSPTHE